MTASEVEDDLVALVKQRRRGDSPIESAENDAALGRAMGKFLIDEGAGEELRIGWNGIVTLRNEKAEALWNRHLRRLLAVEGESGDNGGGRFDLEQRLQLVVPGCDEFPGNVNWRGYDDLVKKIGA